MARVGVIGGTIFLGKDLFSHAREVKQETPFGPSKVYLTEQVVFHPRHGAPGDPYIFPHRILHGANLWALKRSGAEEIVSFNSTGSLKSEIRPGTLVVPNDFISFFHVPTVFPDRPEHIIPLIHEGVRQKILQAANKAGLQVQDGGVYWQSTGPRLETKAEVAMISRFADLVGMTMGSEATVACELNLPYATLCTVDNYAHGIIPTPLTIEAIREAASRQAEACTKILACYLEARL